MISSSRVVFQVTVVVLLTMAAEGTRAYNYVSRPCGQITGYNNGHMTFNYANNLSAAEKTDISTALFRLTEFSDSSITVNDNGDSSFSVNNGQNEIYHDTSHATAQCALVFNATTCAMVEVDIRFGDEPWVTGEDSDHWPYLPTEDGGGRSILATAVHEGGHCIGVGHENDRYNMMGEDFSHVTRNQTNTYYGPGEDLSDALIDRWGKRSTTDAYRDVGVTVMRFDVADGEYSDHKFGVMRNLSGGTLPVVGSFAGQDIYEVVAGDTVQMELTFENNGEKNSETFNVGFYLSTNSFISTSDTLLRSDNGYLQSRGLPYEVTETVTIPIGTTPGNYYLGAYADHDNLISETTSANNIAYYPITVLPPPADLTVSFAGLSDSTLLPREDFTVLAITSNVGEGPASATTLNYYRSTNSTISTADTYIGTDSITALLPGSTHATGDSETAPSVEGTWWYGACVVSVPEEEVTSNQCSAGAQATVAAQAPLASTDPVSDIAATEARLHATVTANGAETTVYFDWGTDNLFDNTLTFGSVGVANDPVSLDIPLTGLVCNTTYQVRVRAVSSKGQTVGNVVEFTTLACPGCL